MKRGDSHQKPVGNVPVVSGFVEGTLTDIYLDSGSQATIVNSSLLSKEILKSRFQVNTKDKLFGISGHLLHCQGCFELKFKVAGKDVCVTAWLSSKLCGVPADVIAGQDLLAALGAKLDFKENVLICGKVKLPFQGTEMGQDRVMGTVSQGLGSTHGKREKFKGAKKVSQWDNRKGKERDSLGPTERVNNEGHKMDQVVKRKKRGNGPRRSVTLARNARVPERKKGKAYPRGIRDSGASSVVPRRDGRKVTWKDGIGVAVRTAQVTVVPPRCEQLVWIEVPFTEGTEVLFEPVGLGMPEVLLASVLTRVKQGRIPIRIMNLSRVGAQLPKGKVLGRARAINGPGAVSVMTMTRKAAALPQVGKEEFAGWFDLSEVQPANKPGLIDALYEYADVFQLPGQALGNTPLVKHVIETGGHAPIAQRPYRVPQSRRKALKENIDEMLNEGIIRPSTSPWASPVVIVDKPDGSIRICCDYRKLNSVSQFDPYPLPLITETLDSLGNARHFSSLDLASGYWQVPLAENSIEKSAFVVPGGKYEWTRMPFGLAGSPSTFQRLMDVLLSGLLFEICLVYIDDIIVFSSTVEEHLRRLKVVLQKLREANLKLKPRKCKFFRKELKYLGHIVSRHGVAMDPEKQRAIKDYPRPKNVKDVRSFLGLTGFYRRFIDGYSDKAKPLTLLQKKGADFVWTPEAEAAFKTLKEALQTGPILKYPDFAKHFVVATDASNVGIGSVLAQVHNGNELPIAYNSRQLNRAEQNYSTIEKELLSVVHAIRTFRPYLYGRRFTLVTDHRPLRWLMSLKDPSSRLARWSILLQDNQYDIVHRPGKKNSNVDALSRIQLTAKDEPNEEEEEIQCVGAVRRYMDDKGEEQDTSELFTPWYDHQRISEDQRRDSQIRKIIDNLEADQPAEPEGAPSEEYRMSDGLLYRITTEINGRLLEQLVVPSSMTRYIIRLNHEPPISGHLGVNKTLGRIRVRFFWKGMAKDVGAYIKSCKSCQERKRPMGKKIAPLQPNTQAQRPFEMVAMDILGPLPTTMNGNRYLLVFTDYFTRWVEAIPLPDQKAETIAREFVTQILLRHGVPLKLLTDCGANFLSRLMKSIYEYFGIRKLSTTPYHPEGNGLVERFNRTLTEMISHYTQDQRDWDEIVPYVIFAYRNAPQESTGESPFFLMYGRDATLPFDEILKPQGIRYAIAENYKEEMAARLSKAFTQARENLQKAAENRKRYYDQKAKSSDIRVGDLVLIYFPQVKPSQVAKLARRWTGPYRVLNQISPVNFEVSKVGSTKTEVVHVNRMKRFFTEGYLNEEITYEEEDDKQYAPLFPREGDSEFRVDAGSEDRDTREGMSLEQTGRALIPGSEYKQEVLSDEREEEAGEEAPSPPPLPPRQRDMQPPPLPAPRYSLRSKGPVEKVEWVLPTPTRRRGAQTKDDDNAKPVHTVLIQPPTVNADSTALDKLVWLVQALGK